MESFNRKILNKFLQIIRQGYASVVSPDTSEYPQGQVTSNGKATKLTRLSTYGVIANPPLDSHVLMFQSQGQESTKFGIYNDFLRRMKGLAEGECALYNTLTGAIVYMKADGSIAIESDVSVDVTAPDINAIASTEVNVTAPTVNATVTNANIIATGTIILDGPDVQLGDGALEKLINKTGMDLYNGHDHTVTGVGPTSIPNQQMVEDTDTTTETKAS